MCNVQLQGDKLGCSQGTELYLIIARLQGTGCKLHDSDTTLPLLGYRVQGAFYMIVALLYHC